MCMRTRQGGKNRLRDSKACIKDERKGLYLYADKDNCCAWMTDPWQMAKGISMTGDQGYCGLNTKEEHDAALEAHKKRPRADRMRPECCAAEDEGSFGDCDSMRWPKGPGHWFGWKFAATDAHFYEKYL